MLFEQFTLLEGLFRGVLEGFLSYGYKSFECWRCISILLFLEFQQQEYVRARAVFSHNLVPRGRAIGMW